MGKVKRFTQEEIDMMIKLYDDGNGLNAKQIAEKMGRGASSVRYRLQSLGVMKVERKISKDYLYKVGEVVNETLRIVELTRDKKYNRKSYIVQSLVYPNPKNNYEVAENNLKRGVGCAYKRGLRVCEESSLYSRTEIHGNLINIEESKNVTPHYNEPMLFKCEYEDCNYTKMMAPSKLVTRGFSCPLCSANISYGQLAFGQYQAHFKLGFESEKILPDLPNRRVDFINWENGMWVEIQGAQHTDVNCNRYESAHAQDLEKRAFAKENTQYNLIEIDMRISSWEYFKEQINNCEYLPSINDEEEKEILKMMEKNKRYPIREIIELYTVEMLSAYEIAEKMGLTVRVITGVLNKNNIKLRNSSEAKLKGKTINTDEVIRLYTVDNLGVAKIGKIYGVSEAPIKRILDDNNIKLRNNSEAQLKGKVVNEDEIIRLYTIDKLSMYKIAEKYSVHNSTISNILKRNNVKIRNRKYSDVDDSQQSAS